MSQLYVFILLFILSCSTEPIQDGKVEYRNLSNDFKTYWFNGEAELTSYKLEQARYGEIHTGTAMLIYVTEDFSKIEYTKADRKTANDVPVFKLNATKKFVTGIYPYSMMRSIFQPLQDKGHALKVSMSSQEWCGHSYMQILNKQAYELDSHSYFGGEADQKRQLKKAALEDELWTLLRINPEELPVGNIELIPSFFYLRLRHAEISAYQANTRLTKLENEFVYEVNYPSLKRTLTIRFENIFPYQVLAWEEESVSGFGDNTTTLKTKATKMKSLRTTYWNKNHNNDRALRVELGLD